jgi:hypothetical protein
VGEGVPVVQETIRLRHQRNKRPRSRIIPHRIKAYNAGHLVTAQNYTISGK